MADSHEVIPHNFIHDIIDADLASGKHDHVVTRFPPEPNGYLHIGHAKAIVLNFGTAEKYDGRCHLRFDDTNPLTESVEYVESMQEDIQWLGYDWGDHLFYASDYFEKMFDCAVHLIRRGKAYVDSLSMEEIREYRGTVTEPGRFSPYRGRSIDENLDLFHRMRAGEFADGEHVLRAKIGMDSPNMLMRDPLLYRIRHARHHHRGDDWCIYPMYDFAHCLEDAFEAVTHSLCSLEFENNREVYDWVIRETEVENQPQQIEFARLNMGYTVMSKRKLLRLVEGGLVEGWDDPRLPTLAGLRRRGVPPEAIRTFCHRIGVTKANSRVELELFENTIRDELNMRAPRVMAVTDPLKVTITNFDGDTEWLDASYYPHDVPLEGSRKIPFTRELFIERDDFEEHPPKGFYRMSPGQEVRLRYGYYVTCQDVIKDDSGRIIELLCTYDPDTRSGTSADGRKVKGTIHWVSATEGIPCELRLYDRLFAQEDPEEDKEKDFLECLNPDSLILRRGVIEPSVLDDDPTTTYQFERRGYFRQDPKNTGDLLVFNRVVTLRDTWAKHTEEPTEAPKPKKPRAPQKPQEPTESERDRLRAEDSLLADRYQSLQDQGLHEETADVLTGDRHTLAFFDEALKSFHDPNAVGTWLVNEVLHRVDEDAAVDSLGITPDQVAALVEMVSEDRISTQISREVLEDVLANGGDPRAIVADQGLKKVSDEDALRPQLEEIVAAHPDEVQRFRDGNDRLIGFFIGQAMKKTGGTADPVAVREILQDLLSP